jgi:hypothetical protein
MNDTIGCILLAMLPLILFFQLIILNPRRISKRDDLDEHAKQRLVIATKIAAIICLFAAIFMIFVGLFIV